MGREGGREREREGEGKGKEEEGEEGEGTVGFREQFMFGF